MQYERIVNVVSMQDNFSRPFSRLAGQVNALKSSLAGGFNLFGSTNVNSSQIKQEATQAGTLFAAAFGAAFGTKFGKGFKSSLKTITASTLSNIIGQGGLGFTGQQLVGMMQNIGNKARNLALAYSGMGNVGKAFSASVVQGFATQYLSKLSYVPPKQGIGPPSLKMPARGSLGVIAAAGIPWQSSAAMKLTYGIQKAGIAIGMLAARIPGTAKLFGNLSQKMEESGNSGKSLMSSLGGVAGVVLDLGKVAIAAFAGMTALPFLAVNISRPFLDAYANIEKLKTGLANFVGPSGAYRKAVEGLASLPGVSKDGAYRATTGMLGTGRVTFNESQQIIRGFSKGVSQEGGGQAELEMVLLAVKQILSKPKISAEEINTQIVERFGSFRATMEDVFGTSDLETINKTVDPTTFILKMAAAYDKLDANMDSPANKLEIFDDKLTSLRESIGAALAPMAFPLMDSISEAITTFIDSGMLDEMASSLSQVFSTSNVEAFMIKLPDMISGLTATGDAVLELAKDFQFLGEVVLRLMPGLGWLLGGGLRGIRNFFNGDGDRLKENADQELIHNRMLAAQKAKKERERLAKNDPKAFDEKVLNKRASITKESLDIDRSNNQLLREIKDNTKDLNRAILGGGNLGAMGITAEEIYTKRKGGDKLEQAFQLIRESMLETSIVRGAY